MSFLFILFYFFFICVIFIILFLYIYLCSLNYLWRKLFCCFVCWDGYSLIRLSLKFYDTLMKFSYPKFYFLFFGDEEDCRLFDVDFCLTQLKSLQAVVCCPKGWNILLFILICRSIKYSSFVPDFLPTFIFSYFLCHNSL